MIYLTKLTCLPIDGVATSEDMSEKIITALEAAGLEPVHVATCHLDTQSEYDAVLASEFGLGAEKKGDKPS